MERFTYRTPNGFIMTRSTFDNMDALYLLADYEDTGLTPKEITAMQEWVHKITEARDEERLLVLPVPLGTPVYVVGTPCDGLPRGAWSASCPYSQDCTRNSFPCPQIVKKRPFTLSMYKGLGRTFWLSKEEAAATIPKNRRLVSRET